MKNKISLLLASLMLIVTTSGYSQGIEFFKGNLADALAKAKETNKMVFIDFYADWCAPCKSLDANVFPLEKIGLYFNEKFISVKIDTDLTENKSIVKQYKVRSMPTLMFLDNTGKLKSITSGALSAENLLQTAKIATGDELSFLDIYDKFKASNNDLTLMKQVLNGALTYVPTIDNKMDHEKWVLRINKIFEDYVTKKMGDDLINSEDYKIITTFHKASGENDKLMEFINSNMDKYIATVGKGPAYYILEYNNNIISNLAKSGNDGYKKYLNRIKGDMATAYSVMDSGSIKPYEMYKYLYDSEYMLFFKDDIDSYIENMERYFIATGDGVTGNIFSGAAQKMYLAMGKKMNKSQHQKAIEWMIKSLQYDIPLTDKINVIAMLGDSSREIGALIDARKYYNQAYMESIQMKDGQNKRFIQMKLKKKMAEIDIMN